MSDVEEMELGVVEGNTPVDGHIPKGLPGMASSGRRERTFSTGKDKLCQQGFQDVILCSMLL